MDLRHLRENYSNEGLDENSVFPNPFAQFDFWFQEAINAQLPEPNAMILSTVDNLHHPHSRTVLLKGVENGHFIFFTNYQSQKARQMQVNPNVSLLFLWLELQRQVKITGTISKISPEASDEYFYSRPLGSQIGAHVSEQSAPIAGRQVLEDKLDALTKYFETHPITRPEHWGGYKVLPTQIEFWKGRPNRLHDRILYTRTDESSWKIGRLSP